jgi:spermidine synthase
MAAFSRASAASFSDLITGWSYVAGIVVLPAALISGVQFPLLIALLGRGRAHVSQHLGTAYAWNTLGAIAGSLVGGFGAMPLMGALGFWQAIAALLAAWSLLVIVAAPQKNLRAAAIVTGMAILTVGSIYSAGPTAAWRHSGIGIGRTIEPTFPPNAVQQWINENRQALQWETDGIESSIAISSMDGLSLIVNGKSDGNALNDSATQVGMAVLGAVLHKDPKTALVIGLGTGETVGWLAEMRGIERVDVVELEPAVDEMVLRCRELNWDTLNHPRVRRIYNDGREFVLTTTNKYDLVISEPSNPYRAGVAALYTTEFYQAVRDRLNPDGIFIQWLQAYDVDNRTVQTVLATARSVFDHVEVWQTLPQDLQLVCSAGPIDYSADELRERIASSAVKDGLAKAWKVDSLEGFLSHFVGNSQWADTILNESGLPLNTDDRTILEYRFAKSLGRTSPFATEATRQLLKERSFHRPKLSDPAIDWNAVELRRQDFNLIFGSELSDALLENADDRSLVAALNLHQKNDFAGALARWPAAYLNPTDNIQRLVLARCYAELARPECLELTTTIEPQFPIEVAAIRAVYHFHTGDLARSTESLEQFYTLLRNNPWMVPLGFKTAIARTIEVAKRDRDAARRLLPLLSKPFASHRYDYLRKLARFVVAEQLGADAMVEALSETEPNIRWTAPVLKARAAAYLAVRHPLAKDAQRDWESFQQAELAE